MTRILVDPTAERDASARKRTPRPQSLEGHTIGLLDISKARGNVFLDALEQRFSRRGMTVKRYIKPTFARTAPLDLKQRIAEECTLVIEALAD